ncbi:Tetratricopeptide repeat-containing protein [Chitinophaga sp. YR573]|uniref:tetratricopeptide repeat protein n=1 Tax=Chitinophaga sp. YR573 TaxID=1881040 RepID=UPI0008C402E6|nr:tetratricopeptide repeat protein [Chitinophaga sp. YR573]SEW38432.1 Tetratricopeptide repeat-containing protein [Chitinophaga sp. YR573]
MANNLVNNDKILKVFSNIRCLNRDQLPRYLDGRLTDVEKHLVEQHLVDCNLCNEALHVLQQPQYREKYQSLSVSIQQYIRNSIKQVSHVQKAERYQRNEQKKESLLIYFWVVAAIALAAGGIYLVQQEKRFKIQSPKPLASAADVKAIQASSTEPIGAAKQDTVTAVPVPVPTPPVVVKENAVKPVVKKDSLKVKDTLKVKVAPVIKPVVKTDSVAKKASPAVKPPEDKKSDSDAKKVAVPKDSPPVKKDPPPVKKEEPKVAAKDTDDKKTVTKVTAPVETNNTDEFLYKAAMVYHQQGDLNEAISRYKHLSTSSSRYGELARYQLAVCYRSKGQTGKARRMFKEVVGMNGSMKDKAQAALDNL